MGLWVGALLPGQNRFRMSSMADEGRVEEALVEHQNLVAAMKAHDPVLAGECQEAYWECME